MSSPQSLKSETVGSSGGFLFVKTHSHRIAPGHCPECAEDDLVQLEREVDHLHQRASDFPHPVEGVLNRRLLEVTLVDGVHRLTELLADLLARVAARLEVRLVEVAEIVRISTFSDVADFGGSDLDVVLLDRLVESQIEIESADGEGSQVNEPTHVGLLPGKL